MLFRRKPKPAEPIPERDPEELKALAMAAAIDARKVQDPLVGVKIGGRELYARCLDALEDERGVHVETLLAVLGAIAGFACPAAIAEAMTRAGVGAQAAGVMVVEGADGRTYWMGDMINDLLVEGNYSVWSLVAGQAQALGATTLPDVAALLRHVASTIGGDDFAAIRVPDEHRPATTPLEAVRALWPKVRPILLRYCDEPRQWPLLASLAAQQAQRAAVGTLDPALAATILVESAFPLAKLAPGSLGTASSP